MGPAGRLARLQGMATISSTLCLVQSAHAGPGARPSESELFSGDPEDASELSVAVDEAPSLIEAVEEKPLTIGGSVYLRAVTSATEGESASQWSFSTPFLLDAYFDGRPSDRVRGYVRTRTRFNPSAATGDDSTQSNVDEPEATLSGGANERGPTTALDQVWISFDIAHAVFVTAGRQHDTWGTAHIFNPTDFLHKNPRNPFELFDARLGSTMLKLHVPWEEQGWNLYVYGLTEDTEAVDKVGKIAGAARLQLTLGTTEISGGTLLRRSHKPQYAVDVSTGLGALELYGECALWAGSDVDRISRNDEFRLPSDPSADLPTIVEAAFPRHRSAGPRVQATVGSLYELYTEAGSVYSVGAEYAFNQLGYDDPEVYTGLFAPRQVPLEPRPTPLQLGRHYAAFYLLADSPAGLESNKFRLALLSNLSDRSLGTQLDYTLKFLGSAYFESFVTLHLGPRHGEFRGGAAVELPDANNNLVAVPQLSRPATRLDAGLALRVNL